MEERLIEIFKEYLPAWSWEEWQAAGSSDKEDIVINALADLGPDMPIEVDEAYDLFWDWAAGLTEADFRSGLKEANRVVRGLANNPWYSGGFRGLNDIDTRVTPEETARIAAENEARRQKQAELEAERRARAKEKNKQLAIQRAEDAIAKGVIDEYNKEFRLSILSKTNSDVYPAIDPETKELVFDMAEKKRILDPILQQIEAEKEAKKAAEKEAEAARAAKRKAEKPITYYLYAEVVINGETMRDPDGTRVVGQDNLVNAAKEVARKELKWVNTERKFYVAGGHPFNWDGVITIICENPDGTEESFRTFKVRTNEGLEEAAARKSEEDDQLEAKCLAAAQKAIETRDIEIYNRGRWSRFILSRDYCPAIDPETLELVYDPVRKSEICDQARRAYFKRQSEYRTNYAASRKAKAVGNIEEAVRVVSDSDALYHYTNPLPFCKILKSDSLRIDINEGAVCFTTDANYRIYGCPIGLQFSRQKLIDAGYELEEYDDYQPEIYGDDRAEDASTESEERVYETVKGIKKLLTAVHIHWSPEGMTQDQAPDSLDYPFIDVAQSARGDIIGDDNPKAVSLADSIVWKISMSYFRRQLRELQAAGIKIYEYGTPMKDIYWLDENNKLHDGPMTEIEEEPASAVEEPVPALV